MRDHVQGYTCENLNERGDLLLDGRPVLRKILNN